MSGEPPRAPASGPGAAQVAATGGPVSSAAGVLERCAFCRRRLDAGDITLTVYRDGAPFASYHEQCRPDRRRSGCSGSAC